MSGQARYSNLSIALHWLMLVMLVAVYCLMEFRGYFPRGSEGRDAMKHWHYVLGLSVFVLVWIRIAARAIGGVPPITPSPSRLQQLAAKAVHVGMYALMIGMPIGGWIILSAENKPVPFFGLTLPPLVGPNEELAHLVEEIHEAASKVGYVLLAVHAAAALYHHNFMRDDTVRRMMPGRRENNS